MYQTISVKIFPVVMVVLQIRPNVEIEDAILHFIEFHQDVELMYFITAIKLFA